MKFKKIVSVGIDESILTKAYQKRLHEFSEEYVSLAGDSESISSELKNADCLLVWFNGADREIIDKAPNLKYIGALATGVAKIDVAYAASKGITVTNIPGYSTEAVSELVFAVLLENLREICRAKTESKQARTSEASFSGREIKGKDFGIVGFGRIGSRVAEIAAGFGANVYYWSRSKKPEHEGKFKYEGLDQLITHCDFVSVNLALNSETEKIFDAKRIAAIKKGSIVVNTAPVELFDLEALNERLAKKDLTFIFDHTDPGDISDQALDRLRKHENCITYPVLGYITQEAKITLQEMFIENIENFLKGSPINRVN